MSSPAMLSPPINTIRPRSGKLDTLQATLQDLRRRHAAGLLSQSMLDNLIDYHVTKARRERRHAAADARPRPGQ